MQISATSLNDLIIAGIEAALLEAHTGLPAKVVSFDPSTQSCSVQPLLQSQYEDTDGVLQTTDLPILTDVPIIYPGSGAWALTFPLAQGDTVYLTFAEASMDELLVSDGTQTIAPRSQRRNDLSDAVCIPGFRVRSKAFGNIDPNAQNLVLGRVDGSTQIVLGGDGSIVITASGNININSSGTVDITGGTISLNGGGHPVAFGDNVGNYLLNHCHLSAAPGSPTSSALNATVGLSDDFGSSTVSVG